MSAINYLVTILKKSGLEEPEVCKHYRKDKVVGIHCSWEKLETSLIVGSFPQSSIDPQKSHFAQHFFTNPSKKSLKLISEFLDKVISTTDLEEGFFSIERKPLKNIQAPKETTEILRLLKNVHDEENSLSPISQINGLEIVFENGFSINEEAVLSVYESSLNLNALLVDCRIAQSRLNAGANTSLVEQRLVEKILDMGLPKPDRKFKLNYIDNMGRKRYTVPDFVWHEAKLAVELDGYYFHMGQDINRIIEDNLGSGFDILKAIKKDARLGFMKDAAKRRQLGLKGYSVFVVYDTEIMDSEGLNDVVSDIVGLYKEFSKS